MAQRYFLASSKVKARYSTFVSYISVCIDSIFKKTDIPNVKISKNICFIRQSFSTFLIFLDREVIFFEFTCPSNFVPYLSPFTTLEDLFKRKSPTTKKIIYITPSDALSRRFAIVVVYFCCSGILVSERLIGFEGLSCLKGPSHVVTTLVFGR